MRKIEKAIEHYAKSNAHNPHDPLAATIQPMKEKFTKYWEPMKEILAVGLVIDPRYKMRYLWFDLEGTLAASELSTTLASIRSAVLSLWALYVPTPTASEPSSQTEPARNVDEETARFLQYMNVGSSGSGSASNAPGAELDLYLEERNVMIPEDDSFDILLWWKSNASRFPGLSELARALLMIPMTSVASESAFSTGGRVIDDHRARLNEETVEALVCAQDWLKSSKTVIEL
jgi:hypothetical protein